MSTTQPPNPAYTLEHAQQDIATLRGQLALQQDIVSTVSDKALLLYAPDQHAIPRGPTSWSFEDGTVQGWTAAANGAVTNSAVTAAGWPTDGSKSLLLTANGSGQPQASSSTALGTDTTGVTSFVPSQPGDPVAVSADIYCPAGLNNVYCGIKWRDDTGALISEVDCADTVFTAGQVKTLAVAGTAPDLTAGFAIVFGDHHTDANGTLIYGDNIKVQGNLAVSISPGGGTDPVGNVYPAGIKLRGPAQVFSLTSGDAAESTAATFLVGSTGSGLTRQLVTQIFTPALGVQGTAVFSLSSQSADGTVPASAIMSEPLTITSVAALVGGVTETWHNLTGLIAGWTVTTARYKMLADSGFFVVEIINLVAPGAPPVDGTKIWPASSLPSGYRPAITSPRHVVYHTGAAGSETPALEVGTDGSIAVYGVGSTSVARIDASIRVSTL